MADFVTRMRDLSRLVLRNAQKTGETGAEWFDQQVSLQRLTGQVRALDRERSGLIRQIGMKVYGLHGQGKIRNQDVLVDCQRIDAIIAEIGKIKHEIEQIRAASLEKGIEIPVLEDEAPLDEEEAALTPPPAAVEAPAEPPEEPVAPEEAEEAAPAETEAAEEPKPEE